MARLRFIDRELLDWDESKHPRDRLGRFTFSIGSPVKYDTFHGEPRKRARDAEVQNLVDKADRIGTEMLVSNPYEPSVIPELAVQALYDANEYGILVPEFVSIGNFGAGERHIPARYEVSEQGLVEVNTGSPTWDDTVDVENQYAEGWWSQPSLIGLLHHEMGHHGHLNEIGYDEYERQMNQDIPYELKDVVGDKVSIYGTKSPTEFVAEVVAGHMNGIDYPSDVLYLYDSYGGPRLDVGLKPNG